MALIPPSLPPYSGESPTCIACGHDGADTEFMADGICNHRGKLSFTVSHGEPTPRLHRSCSNCAFAWDEACIEPQRATVDAEKP